MSENLSYIGGADVGATKQLTFSVDFLGEHVVNASRLEQGTAVGIGNTTQVADTAEAAGALTPNEAHSVSNGNLGMSY